MARYRKSKKIGPFRITMTQKGVSTSIGAGPFRITKGADGKVRRAIRIPGTGIYDTRVVGPSPRKPASGRGQQSPMQSILYPQPQLPPAGWYADPTGQASRRYWDGRQWTSATDPIPSVLTQHNCSAVVNQKRAVAVAVVRGWRAMIAAMRGDGDASSRILEEVEGCPVCLSDMITYFLSAAAPIYIGVANGNQALAIAQAEKQLAEYIGDALREISDRPATHCSG